MSLVRRILFLIVLSGSMFSPALAQTNPESLITVPEGDATDNIIDRDQHYIFRDDYSVSLGDNDGKVKGFGFTNSGGNSTVIVPEPYPGMGPTRFYDFSFKDRARQDIMLWVSDAADSYISHFLESAFYFFPRLILPAIAVDETDPSRLVVTLPTKETFFVDRQTKVVVSGVLKEYRPLDMNPIASKRQYAAISYSGKGLYLRANIRANSPQLAKTVMVYSLGKTCELPGRDVFNQAYDGAMTFKFATDIAFNTYLMSKCKFGIPAL
jgi:hypothetical protein